jgi:signal transduction histidine kinase
MNDSARSVSSNPPQRGSIWVVDDSPLEIELAKRVLGAHHDVKIFFDGPSVLEQLANGEKPDLLVLDWHMPVMSGLEMCRFLRENYDEASLPILVLTATGGQDDLLEGLAAGANDFVTKEFDPAELLARVATLVRAKALHEGLKRTELATRRAREAAEQANLAKDVFLATISHELRTPLNAILGWARLLNEKEFDSATFKRGLTTIERNARIQVQLIEDILDTTRAVSGKLRLELSTFDLSAVIRSAVDTLKPSADGKQLCFELALVPSCRMTGDVDRLQQVTLNLINNAIKFSTPGGSICVRLLASDSGIELSVSDTGAGIDAQFLPHVFDRFRQQDDKVSRRYSGLGLGLALVKHIVQAHGGTVRAESDGEGRGAKFTLSLPNPQSARAARGDSDRPSPPPATPTQRLPTGKLAGLRILAVDDEEDTRELLVVVLEQQGATVDAAASCSEALALLERSSPDVLVSDIGLPGADGYELIRTLRAREGAGTRLPAIALTAYARREDRRLALEAGFQAHVAKPVDPVELVNAVHEWAKRERA